MEQFSRVLCVCFASNIGECMYTHVSTHNKILNIYNRLGHTWHPKTASFSSSTAQIRNDKKMFPLCHMKRNHGKMETKSS